MEARKKMISLRSCFLVRRGWNYKSMPSLGGYRQAFYSLLILHLSFVLLSFLMKSFRRVHIALPRARKSAVRKLSRRQKRRAKMVADWEMPRILRSVLTVSG